MDLEPFKVVIEPAFNVGGNIPPTDVVVRRRCTDGEVTDVEIVTVNTQDELDEYTTSLQETAAELNYAFQLGYKQALSDNTTPVPRKLRAVK